MRSGPVTKDTSTVALGLAQIRVGDSASNIATTTSVLSSTKSIGALATTNFTNNVDYWKLESGFPMLEDLTLPLRETASLECEFKELSPYNLALAKGIDPNADVSATATLGDAVTTLGTVTGTIAVTDAGGVTTENWTVVFTAATAASVCGSITGHVGDWADVTSGDFAPDNSGNPYFTIPDTFFTGTWAEDDTYTFKTTEFVAGTSVYADNHAGEIALGSIKAPDFVRMEAVYTYPNQTNHMYIVFPRANVTSSMEISLQAEDNANVGITFEAKRADSETSGGDAAWDAAPLGRIYFD